MDTSGSSSDVSAEDTRAVFEGLKPRWTPLTASDVAAELGCPPDTARRSLSKLVDDDELAVKEVGDDGSVWWRTSDEESTADGDESRLEFAQFAQFVHAVGDHAIFTLDPDGRVNSWNEGAARIKGYDESEILGEHFSTFYTAEDVEEGVPSSNLAAAEAQGRVEDEGWRVRADGTTFWADVTITAIRDDDGSLQGFTKVTRDLTERKRTTDEHRLRQVVDSSLARAPSVEAGLEAVIDETCRMTEWSYGEVWLPRENRLERSVTTAGEGEPSASLAPGDGLVGRVYESGDSEWISDVSDVDRGVFDSVSEAGDERSGPALCVPVAAEAGVEAVLLFATTDPKGVDRYLADVVEAAAAELGALVARKRAEKQLERERDFLDGVLETVPTSVLVVDSDGFVERANERAREHLEFDEAGASNLDDRDVYDEDGDPVPPDERPYAEVFATGDPVENWTGQVDLSNRRAWVSVNVAPLGEEWPPERVLLSVDDVTARRQQARRLERRRDELEAELDEVYDRVTDAFFALDDEWQFTHVNDRAEELLERSEGELLGATIWEAFPDTEGTPFESQYRRAFERQEPVEFEAYYSPLDGWFEAHAYPSETGLSVYFRNVTDRVERTRRLERYETIVDTVQDGVYVVDDDGVFTTVNDAYSEMLGYDADELVGRHASTVVDEDVMARAREMGRELGCGERQTAKLEADLRRADGDTIRAEATFALLPGEDESGRVGVVRDVTERVRRERELAESERRYRAIVANFPNGALALYDEDLRYTAIGGEIYDDVEASAEGLEGTSIEERLPPETFERMESPLRSVFDGETDEFETTFEDRTFHVRTLPVRTEDGDVFAGMVMSQDVTERVDRERELERYETIVETIRDGVYAVDEAGDFVLVNDAFCDLTGWSREELLGRDATTVHDEEIAAKAKRLVADADSAGESISLELDLRTKDGDRVPVESRFQPFPTGEGRGRCGVVRDVSDRQQYEERLRLLNDTVRSFLREESTEGIHDVVVGAASEIFDIPGVGVYHYDAEREDLYPASTSIESEFMMRDLPRVPADDSTLTGQVYVDGESKRSDDILESPNANVSADETAMRSGLFVPIGDHGVLVGGARDVGAFDDSVQRLAEVLAANAEAAYDRIDRERELHEYGRIVETIDDGVYVLDESRRFQRVNDAFVSMTRYDREELLGSHASMVFGEKFDELDEDARGDFEAQRTDVAVFDEDIYTAADETITVESRFKQFSVADGTGRVGVVRDITERKEYERELESRARQQGAVATLGHEALESTDLDDLFERATRFVADVLDADYCKVLDLTDDGEELLVRQGVGWRDGIVGEGTISAVDDDSQAAYTLDSVTPVVVGDMDAEDRFSGPELLTSHGVKSGISTVVGSADDPWGVLGVHDTDQRSFTGENVAFVQSIANVLASAIEREKYREELENVVAELEESNERLEQFAYVASHDLQEPLRMVSNYLQLVENRYGDELDEDGREFIDFAVDGAERMRTMINDLLAYSRIESRAKPPEPTDCDDAVQSVLRDLQMQIEEHDADIAVESLPTVVADRNQLEQVFQNLVSNAIKYCDEDTPRVEIGGEERDDEWEFRVADNGIGIDPDRQDRIFEVFQRLHGHEEYSGTGIGLSLCRKIVERHGGRIWVESEPDAGSTFRFTIPKSEADDA